MNKYSYMGEPYKTYNLVGESYNGDFFGVWDLDVIELALEITELIELENDKDVEDSEKVKISTLEIDRH